MPFPPAFPHPRPGNPVNRPVNWFWALGLLTVAASAAEPPILTPTQLKNLSVEELLQQEVISVSRRPEALGTVASNVYYMTGESSRRTGATRLPEVLRMAPNLFVAQSSSHHWGVTSRGFLRTNAHSSKLLVLIDGRTVYSTLFSNVFWDTTDTFRPDLVAIEVLSGPNGANWGANAVNGIINIRSKSAHDTLGSLLSVTAGPELFTAEARHGVNFGRDGAVRFYASRADHGPTYSVTGAKDEKDSWHATLAGFRADWGQAATGEFTLQGEAMSGEFDSRPLPAAESDSAHLMLTWRRSDSPTNAEWARLYYDFNRRDTNSALLQTTQTFDFEFQRRQEVARGLLLWGGNFRRIRDVAADTVGFAILPEKLWYNVMSGFVQYEQPLSDNLTVTAGVRVEDTGLGDVEVQPTARLAWRRDHHVVWLSGARAARTPSRLDRGFFAPKEPPFFITGGPEFTSEDLRAFELGWRTHPRSNLSYTLTAYLHEYDDLRSVDPIPPINVENDVEGRAYGIETFMDWQVSPMWRLRGGGFWMKQETWIQAGGTDTEQAKGEASVPEYQAQLRSTFQLSPTVELWLALRHVDEVPAAADGGGIVPAYTELDARIGWFVRPGVELSLIGRNLLNRSHPEIGGLNLRREIPRSIYARVRWEF